MGVGKKVVSGKSQQHQKAVRHEARSMSKWSTEYAKLLHDNGVYQLP